MVFDKARVYTAVNADELVIGDVVILADSPKTLKDKVLESSNNVRVVGLIDKHEDTLYRICPDDAIARGGYALAYLIAKYNDPLRRLKTAYAEGYTIQCKYKDELEWRDIKDPCFDSEEIMDYRIRPGCKQVDAIASLNLLEGAIDEHLTSIPSYYNRLKDAVADIRETLKDRDDRQGKLV